MKYIFTIIAVHLLMIANCQAQSYSQGDPSGRQDFSLYPVVSYDGSAGIISPCIRPDTTFCLTYQGYLTEADGRPGTDSTILEITFSMYPDLYSTIPPLWSETHRNVEIRNGLFTIVLGEMNPIAVDIIANYPSVYLGVKIGSEAELLPRVLITGTLFAARAGTARRADTADVAKTIDPDTPGIVRTINGRWGPITLRGAGGTAITDTGGTFTISSVVGGGGGIQELRSIDFLITITNPTGPQATIGINVQSIDTKYIKDGAVTASKLAPGIPTQQTVLTSPDGTISINQPDPYRPEISLAPNAVGTPHLQSNAVTSSKIADGSIADAEISPSAGIGASKLDPKILTENEIIAGAGVTISNSGGNVIVSIGPIDTLQMHGDVTGTLRSNTVANNAITAPKIATGQVVKSLNGLKDAVAIKAGQGISVNASGNDVTIGLTAATDTGGMGLRAWGRITAAGVLASGYGIASVTYNALDTTYTINFAKPFTSWTSYAPMVTPIATEYCEIGVVQPMTASSCRVTLFLLSGTPLTKRKYADDFSIGVPGLP